MNWLLPIARIIDAWSPWTIGPVRALLVAVAEREAHAVQQRLGKLEAHPIDMLDPDVPEVVRILYEQLQRYPDEDRVQLSDDLMSKYFRALSVLRANGLIGGTDMIGGPRFDGGVYFPNPTFILFMFHRHEDADLRERFLAHVDQAPVGQWLQGGELAEEFALPLRVVRAELESRAAKGLGLLSKVGASAYRPLA